MGLFIPSQIGHLEFKPIGKYAVLFWRQRVRPCGIQFRVGTDRLHHGIVRPRPLTDHTVLGAHKHLKVHVRHPARVPPWDNGHEFTLAIGVGHLVSTAIRQPFGRHGYVSGIVAIAVTMPNVDPHVGHRLTIVRPHDAHALTQLHPFPILADVLSEEEVVLRQIQGKWPRGFAGNEHAVAPACAT